MKLQKDNKILAGKIVTWTDRASVNKAIRYMAGHSRKPIAILWKELYDQLRYKYSMGLSQRSPAPFIQHVREDEWAKVQQSVVAMCYQLGIGADEVLEAARMSA